MELKKYLKLMGIKKTDFSKKIGITVMTLNHVINGRPPNLKTALAIEIATDGNVRCRELIPQEIQKSIAKHVTNDSSSNEETNKKKTKRKKIKEE